MVVCETVVRMRREGAQRSGALYERAREALSVSGRASLPKDVEPSEASRVGQ